MIGRPADRVGDGRVMYDCCMETGRKHPDAIKAREFFASIQDENGVDLTLIRENLRRTPQERLERADAARRQALYIRGHARRIVPGSSAPADR